MTDYIEREAAIEALCCDCSVTGDCRPGERCVDYMRIKAIPAADVREVKRGKWERLSHRHGYGYRCTECGALYNKRKGRLNFCPNCGADMREKSCI